MVESTPRKHLHFHERPKLFGIVESLGGVMGNHQKETFWAVVVLIALIIFAMNYGDPSCYYEPSDEDWVCS